MLYEISTKLVLMVKYVLDAIAIKLVTRSDEAMFDASLKIASIRLDKLLSEQDIILNQLLVDIDTLGNSEDLEYLKSLNVPNRYL